MTPTIVQGEPRSIAELVFVAGLHPCRGCRERELSALELITTRVDEGFVLDLVGPCPRCRSTRGLRFRSSREPASLPKPEWLSLGGPDPSRLITVVQLVTELDRLFGVVRTRLERLSRPMWRRNARAIDRAARCVIELMKFLDGAEMPTSALDAEGLADRAARPERYTADWLIAQRTRYLELIERSTLIAPHVWQLEDLVWLK